MTTLSVASLASTGALYTHHALGWFPRTHSMLPYVGPRLSRAVAGLSGHGRRKKYTCPECSLRPVHLYAARVLIAMSRFMNYRSATTSSVHVQPPLSCPGLACAAAYNGGSKPPPQVQRITSGTPIQTTRYSMTPIICLRARARSREQAQRPRRGGTPAERKHGGASNRFAAQTPLLPSHNLCTSKASCSAAVHWRCTAVLLATAGSRLPTTAVHGR